MRLPLRPLLETAARVVALALLAWALVGTLAGGVRAPGDARLSALDASLAAWTRDSALRGVRVDVDRAPTPRELAWLRALARAGTAVAWRGDVPALAVDAEPIADPGGGVRVAVAAPEGARVRVADRAGAVDSIVARRGASVVAPLLVDRALASIGAYEASAPLPAPLVLRAVVVIGAAGWEGKFVAAALEERGWTVVPRFVVAPRASVVGAQPLALDTARVAAIVALDATAAPMAAVIARFVRQGGGLVLAGSAAAEPAFAPLASGTPGARVAASALLAADSIGPRTLGFYPVAAPRAGAVVLDRRAGGASVVARRVGAGRVVQLGTDESWRWRMEGGEGALNAHRRWWTRLVGAVAHAPPPAAAPRDPLDSADAWSPVDAPRARLVEALGAPLAEASNDRSPPARRPPSLAIFVVAAALLCAEWSSRRLRGAP